MKGNKNDESFPIYRILAFEGGLGVVSHQRLRLRRFDSLVKRSPKLRSELVSFQFLVCFSNSHWKLENCDGKPEEQMWKYSYGRMED